MSKLIDEAVTVLRNLPDDVAAAAAHAIIQYGTQEDEDLLLSEAQADEIERRLEQPDRAFLSLDEVRDRLHRFGT
jgi:hypothetical protein